MQYQTDIADAYQLGELFYKEELEPYKKRGQFMMSLRYLTRQRLFNGYVCASEAAISSSP
ncbi:hypothetical protein PCCS19_50080 [Paenibacillus sp. CCS19]|nr:hypothetical protein PCCS19_50080 [Paenibacillus cellulosilyticus]